MAQEFKRMPSVEKCVSEITDTDTRVRVTGAVIESTDISLILDDGTGTVRVVFAKPHQLGGEKLVRVIGRVMPTDSRTIREGVVQSDEGPRTQEGGVHADAGFEISGEIVQDMEKLDLDVFKKLQYIKNSK